MPAGTGGSENYTTGHVRELNRRGVPAQVVTIGLGTADGRDEFSDVPFTSLATIDEVGTLDGTVIFVDEPQSVATKHRSFQILHNPPPIRARLQARTVAGTRERTIITTSRYAAQLWAEYLDVDVETIHVIHPFAEPAFALVKRGEPMSGAARVLFAGRLSPEKGIYTLLEMLHLDIIDTEHWISFTATSAGADKPQGLIIERVLAGHPRITLVPACKNPAQMAALMAEHDVVVMPSNSQYWHETFGIVSIEAQHAGCRVVASNDGGLPETDCGSIRLVAPDDAEALAQGLLASIAQGPVSEATREGAAALFTVGQSVDTLLDVMARPPLESPATIIRQLEELVRLASPPTPEPV